MTLEEFNESLDSKLPIPLAPYQIDGKRVWLGNILLLDDKVFNGLKRFPAREFPHCDQFRIGMHIQVGDGDNNGNSFYILTKRLDNGDWIGRMFKVVEPKSEDEDE